MQSSQLLTDCTFFQWVTAIQDGEVFKKGVDIGGKRK